MLVNFELRPVEAIAAAERPPLGWFLLTDGYYWLDVAGAQLFRLTEAYLASFGDAGAAAVPRPFVEYYVVRLWEDLLGMAPAVLDPLPPALARRLATDAGWRRWVQSVQHWRNSWVGDDDLVNEEATRWWHDRSLPTSHLRLGPRIWLWRDGEWVRLCWDNQGLEHDGVPAWTATAGEETMPVARFVAELRSFHTRLMSAMAERVRDAWTLGLLPGVLHDPAELAAEHAFREQRGAELFATATGARETDWAPVLRAVADLEARYPGPNGEDEATG